MIGRLDVVVLDCPDPRALAAFYAQLLGMRIERAEDGWVTITDGIGTPLAFQKAPNLKPPRWPDPEHPQQFHLDVVVEDVEVAEPAVLALGATRLDGEGNNFRVYADPAGHPFCLVWD